MTRRAFTMTEALVACFLLTVVVGGSLILFTATMRSAASQSAASVAVRDAATTTEKVSAALSGASGASLPNDDAPYPTWKSVFGDASLYRSANPSDNTQQINTGLYLAEAPRTDDTVRNADGSAVALNGILRPYNRWGTSASGKGVLLYRGASNGDPAPATGRCLWAASYDNGDVVRRRLTANLSSAWNALSFQRIGSGGTAIRYTLVGGAASGNRPEVSSQHSGVGAKVLPVSGRTVILYNATTGILGDAAFPR